jgi:uncharacterized protein YdaU (DUF1376 family)
VSDIAWYPFYVGDYAGKTAHLSLLEHGAYRLLIDHYMATRHPLPADPNKLYRICRARSPRERQAVLSVATAFFIREERKTESNSCSSQGQNLEYILRHQTCDSVIANQLKYSESQSAKAKLRHSHGNAAALPRARVPQSQSDKKEASTPLPPSTPLAHTMGDDASGLKPKVYPTLEPHPSFERMREFIVAKLPHLKRQNATEINRWLHDGATENDIRETVEYCVGIKGASIGSFNYFTAQVMACQLARKERDEQEQRMRDKYAKPE